MVNRRLAILVMTTAILAGCRGPSVFPSGAGAPPEDEPYRLHVSDQLEISVWGQGDLTRTVVVRQEGTIPFPLLGELMARGRTLQELEQVIARGLAGGYLQDPVVAVQLINPRFSVLGEIERPGIYTLDGRVDLLAAISMAGGLSKFGSPRVEVIRVSPDDEKTSYEVDIEAVLSGRRPTVTIHPYDTIHVKRRLF